MAESEAIEKPRNDRLVEAQKAAYLEAYMAQQLQHQQHQQQQQQQQQQQKQFRYEEEKKKPEENGCNEYPPGGGAGIKVPHPAPESTFTVPDDGLGYDDGVRVLRTLGSWTPEYSGIGTRPNPGMLFPDLPYAHDMSGNHRKAPGPPLIQPPPPASPNHRAPTQQQQQPKKEPAAKSNGVSSSGNKSFTCTICGKSLARKDKLVIHTRIHTGEKPYVCEVCDKAFARRDKLVIHMNKMKHRTPTNVAPLGKRSVEKAVVKKEEEESKPPMNIQAAAANWSCEMCGQMMTTKEEWMVHAKAHLEEKITGIGVISPNGFPGAQRPSPGYASMPMGGYATGPQPGNHYQPFLSERQYCPVCRQTFPNKAEFMLHVRAHFDTAVKQEDGSLDGNAICS